jgi:glutamyl-tRNA synthetase
MGGARTALFNYLWAKRNGGRFLLRFEDTDRARSAICHEDSILGDLKWLGIEPDEITARQSERAARHAEVLALLERRNAAYPCFCAASDEAGAIGETSRHACRDIPGNEARARIAGGEKCCWRFRAPSGQAHTFRDRLRGIVSVPADSIGDFVLSRSDGSVTYLLAAVVDDCDSRVTHVIRGEEHLPNAPKQEMICGALGWDLPEWVHIPMILDGERHKLSKRGGAAAISRYRELEWPPDAIVSYLATLSWARAPTDRIAGLDELSGIFDLDSVALAPPVHDESRMRHFGREHMARAPRRELLEACRSSFGPDVGFMPPDAEKISLIDELAPACATLGELRSSLETELGYGADAQGTDVPKWLPAILERLSSIPESDWSSANIKNSLKLFQKELAVKGRDFFHPLRLFLTGRPQGAPLGIILSCVGKREAIRRIGRACDEPNKL